MTTNLATPHLTTDPGVTGDVLAAVHAVRADLNRLSGQLRDLREQLDRHGEELRELRTRIHPEGFPQLMGAG